MAAEHKNHLVTGMVGQKDRLHIIHQNMDGIQRKLAKRNLSDERRRNLETELVRQASAANRLNPRFNSLWIDPAE